MWMNLDSSNGDQFEATTIRVFHFIRPPYLRKFSFEIHFVVYMFFDLLNNNITINQMFGNNDLLPNWRIPTVGQSYDLFFDFEFKKSLAAP